MSIRKAGMTRVDYLPSGLGPLGFGGRPLPGTIFIFSKSAGVYNASMVKGLQPARRSRFFTVARGNSSFSAISETVIPSIPSIFGILAGFFRIVYIQGQILNVCVVEPGGEAKNSSEKDIFLLTICLFTETIKNIGQ